MSTIILTEWSLAMFEPVLDWNPSFPNLERATQNFAARTLSGGVSSMSLNETTSRLLSQPTRLDIALTGVKSLSNKILRLTGGSSNGPNTETLIFATFDSSQQLGNPVGQYQEFYEKLCNGINSSPPSKISYVSMIQLLRAVVPSVKSPAVAVIFVPSNRNVVAVNEFLDLSTEARDALLPLPNGCSLIFVLVPRGNPDPLSSMDFFKTLVALNNSHGQICVCDEMSIDKFSSSLYEPFFASLKLGSISGRIQLHPNPHSWRGGQHDLSNELTVIGTMDRMAMDKLYPTRPYYVLPVPGQQNGDTADCGLEPHFGPLLHAALRLMQGKVVLVSVATDWFGYIEPVEDPKTKKRSILVLNLFPKGFSLAPGGVAVLEESDTVKKDEDDAPSYSSKDFTPVWTSAEAVQSDVGRVLRFARKLPDKVETFYKELNKVRLHALSSCNFQLLDALAEMLMRECQLAASSAGAAELNNVVLQLKQEGQSDACSPLRSSDGRVFPLYE
ncbi:integrator complex subunit 14-like [Paramacrobiotus metropolitanus]|uniref:integrator complex subunit 14-like n=1 Tax=Paramacrobiotus metropolitanus TaxID=2943436 RepID=UPI002445EA06|nr:integrator complex subunit 14-like [Paramacrobiotus metropolitanus]